MLIGFLRSGRDFRTVSGDVRGLSGLEKLTLGAVRQAGRLILRPPIEADGVRAVASADRRGQARCSTMSR